MTSSTHRLRLHRFFSSPVCTRAALMMLLVGQPGALSHQHRQRPHAPRRYVSPPSLERLVGEAVIVDDGGGITRHVYLPVTIHGHAASLLLDTGAPTGFTISRQWLREHGVSTTDVLDSLVIGNTVEQNISIDGGSAVQEVPGIPPMIGMAGNHWLAHYDLVFDGPARRVRLYAPVAPAPAPAGKGGGVAHSAGWLPPGITPAGCMPLLHVGADADRYPGLDLQANGQTIVGVFDLGSSATYMNLAAAKLLGIKQSTPHVHRVPPDSMTNFPGAGENHEWIMTTGLVLTMGGRPLPDGPVEIFQTVNEIYGDRTKPELDLGTDLFHDRILFMSYSTNQVCLSTPLAVPVKRHS